MKSPNRSGTRRQSSKAMFIRLMLLCLIIVSSVAWAEPDVANPPTLDGLIQEALTHSPMITSARKRWQALTKVPVQLSTLPDPTMGLQQLTVGSPQPFSGYEASDHLPVLADFGERVGALLTTPVTPMLTADTSA